MSSTSRPPDGRRPRRVVRGGRPGRRASAAGARAAAPGRAAAGRAGEERVHPGLRLAAGYAWRLLAVGAVVYAAFKVLGRFELVAVAVFLGLVVTALLRPPTDLLARVVPRPLAVAVALIGSIVVVLGLLALVGSVVAAEAGRLVGEFRGGVGRISRWLEQPPFRISHSSLQGLRERISAFLSAHRGALISRAVSGANRAVEALTGAALALFCSVFFIYGGDRMWRWFHAQLPETARSAWERAARAAWTTFAGYTRGIIIVAASNATLVGIALVLLRVPLALPLTVLVFFATFIPLIGAPIALAVATVVALAGRGPVIAAIVLVLIVVVGQIEGHVLHPLVMSWAVQLHPVVVAISVIAGSLVAGVIGAIVAVPMVSVVWSVVRTLRAGP